MLVLDVVVTVAMIVANGVAAYSDFTRGRFAEGMSNKDGVPLSLLPVSGTLKAAAAAGLALGLAGVPLIGIADATGLVLFFVGAVGVHLRAHERRNVFVTRAAGRPSTTGRTASIPTSSTAAGRRR